MVTCPVSFLSFHELRYVLRSCQVALCSSFLPGYYVRLAGTRERTPAVFPPFFSLRHPRGISGQPQSRRGNLTSCTVRSTTSRAVFQVHLTAVSKRTRNTLFRRKSSAHSSGPKSPSQPPHAPSRIIFSSSLDMMQTARQNQGLANTSQLPTTRRPNAAQSQGLLELHLKNGGW